MPHSIDIHYHSELTLSVCCKALHCEQSDRCSEDWRATCLVYNKGQKCQCGLHLKYRRRADSFKGAPISDWLAATDRGTF